MKFYVYIYRDPSRKNEAIYVGKGCGKRAYDHLTRRDIHPFTHRLQLMKTNGIEPIINVVDMPSEELAFQCEVDTIARLGRKDLGKGPLLNLTDGGEGASGYISTKEHRKKQSDAHKGKSFSAEHCQNISEAQIGRVCSAATRKKQSDAKKGIPKPRITCPHCEKEGGVSIMHRWHFDNCKFRLVD